MRNRCGDGRDAADERGDKRSAEQVERQRINGSDCKCDVFKFVDFVAAFFWGHAPAFVGVVHEPATEIVGVDDENQDERDDAPDNGDKVKQQAKYNE